MMRTIGLLLFLVAVAFAMVLNFATRSRKTEIRTIPAPLRGLVLTEIRVVPPTFFGKQIPARNPVKSEVKLSPGFLEEVSLPSGQAAILDDIRSRLLKGGVSLTAIPKPAPDGYVAEPPKQIDELVVAINTRKRGDACFFHIDLSVERPVYLSLEAKAPVRATVWHRDKSGGVHWKDAPAVIKIEVGWLVEQFVQYHRSDNKTTLK